MVAIRSRSVGHRRPGSLETNGQQSQDDNVGCEQSSANLATLVRSGGDGTKPAMLEKADATVYPGWRHDGELKSVEPVKTVAGMVICSRGRGGEPDKPATFGASAKMTSCVGESHGQSRENAMSPAPVGTRAGVEVTHLVKHLQ